MLKRLSLLAALMAGMASPALAEPVKVVASFSILSDMVREVGGEHVEVTTLVGPDADAHVYQPTPSDARALAAADVAIINGLNFEGWFERLYKASGAKAPIVAAARDVRTIDMEDDGHHGHDDDDHGHGHGHGHTEDSGKVVDPHAWQDLTNAPRYVSAIAQALVEAAPTHAEAFEANAAAYSQRLADLDAWVRAELATIPEDRRRVITSHDSFGYFSHAYGFEFLAPVGISTEAEPSAKEVAALITQMKAENVKAVFVENMSDSRLIAQVARDAGGVVGGELYADALSAADGPAPTFEAMFRHNVQALKAALAK